MTESPLKSGSLMKRRIIWIALSLLAVIVLSVTASFAPQEMKRLVLFHAIYGMACGFMLSWLAGELEVNWGKTLPILSGLIVVVGCLNMALVSYQQFKKERAELEQQQAQDLAKMSMIENLIAEEDPELAERYQEEKQRYSQTFSAYLANRVSVLGQWSSPWPFVFWLGEITVAGGIAAATVHRRDRF